MPEDLQELAAELAELQQREDALTRRLQREADAHSLTFGRPRNPRQLRPAKNLDLFEPEAQPRLF